MVTFSIVKTRLKKITRKISLTTYRSIFGKEIILFFYHVISDLSLVHVKHLFNYKSSVMFDRDLVYLLEKHPLISYEQLTAHRQSHIQLKPNSVFLAFDDGLHECYTVVRPILLKYHIPCTFFITTDQIDNRKMFFRHKISLCIEKITTSEEYCRLDSFKKLSDLSGCSIQTNKDFTKWIKSLQYSDQDLIDQICDTLEVDVSAYLKDNKPYMSRNELSILASDGFTIGSHSKSHPLLEGLPACAIEEEIVGSCETIREITGANMIPFSFPFYGNGVKWSLLEDIRSRNHVVGYYFDSIGIRRLNGSNLGRIIADEPEQDGLGQSNLPELLYRAYQDRVLDGLRKYKRFIPTYMQ